MERARLEVQARRERAVRLLVRGSLCTARLGRCIAELLASGALLP